MNQLDAVYATGILLSFPKITQTPQNENTCILKNYVLVQVRHNVSLWPFLDVIKSRKSGSRVTHKFLFVFQEAEASVENEEVAQPSTSTDIHVKTGKL